MLHIALYSEVTTYQYAARHTPPLNWPIGQPSPSQWRSFFFPFPRVTLPVALSTLSWRGRDTRRCGRWLLASQPLFVLFLREYLL